MSELATKLGSSEQTRVTVERMAEAASAWLAALSVDQRRKATFDFPATDERTLWFYTPTEQGGLPLVEMDTLQQRLAHRLVASGLSFPGYVAASTIMGIENVLDAVEGWARHYPGRGVASRGRDPLLYFVTVFGEPGMASWGWRVGGHHLSVSYAVVNGQLASPTPLFFGSNPAESPLVGPGRLRPLAGEEDLGRELVHALDAEQRETAILAAVAPTDIVQSNRPTVEPGVLPRSMIFRQSVSEAEIEAFRQDDRHRPRPRSQAQNLEVLRYETSPKGLAAARMNPSQREALATLIRQYVHRLPDELAAIHDARLTGPVLEAMHFAWAGGIERRQPHYYRIQGPHLLIEYDDTQDDANHIHSVWRDPEGDFGADLLAEHYRHAH
jgi:hypothetical protein